MNKQMHQSLFDSLTSVVPLTDIAPSINVIININANTKPINNSDLQIDLVGAVNIRDLGGYTNESGQTIRAKRLIRGAQLNTLTSADINKLTKEYHVGVDVDFRTPNEVAKANDPKIDGVKYINAPVVTNQESDANDLIADQDGEQGMINLYSYFISQHGRSEYQKLFNELLTVPDDQAVLYHCSFGKDRTGFATALILTALEFDKQTIYEDYLLSNQYRAAINQAELAVMQKYQATTMELKNEYYQRIVAKQYLDRAYELAEQKYGSMMGYLINGLGLSDDDIQTLQNKYLTKQ